jgi:hypothetical protein
VVGREGGNPGQSEGTTSSDGGTAVAPRASISLPRPSYSGVASQRASVLRSKLVDEKYLVNSGVSLRIDCIRCQRRMTAFSCWPSAFLPLSIVIRNQPPVSPLPGYTRRLTYDPRGSFRDQPRLTPLQPPEDIVSEQVTSLLVTMCPPYSLTRLVDDRQTIESACMS